MSGEEWESCEEKELTRPKKEEQRADLLEKIEFNFESKGRKSEAIFVALFFKAQKEIEFWTYI